MTTMRDFLGQEYGVGDLVLYGASSDRSINMVIGRVVKIIQRKDSYSKELKVDKDGNPVYTVQVQPIKDSRWTQHHGHDYYVDTRLNKRVDPWTAGNYARYTDQQSGWFSTETGEKLTDNCTYPYLHGRNSSLGSHFPGYGGLKNRENPDFVPDDKRSYHAHTWVSHLEQRNDDPKPVSITVTENIVKWNGELPKDVV